MISCKTKKVLISLSTASLLLTSVSAIEISSTAQAVNIAGKQRMFTQRMLKDYAMAGMNNTFGKPNVDLKKIVDDFEDHMKSLIKYTKNDETMKLIKNSLSELEKSNDILENMNSATQKYVAMQSK